MSKKLLLISNSTNPGEAYLGWPRPYIADFLKKHAITRVLFIPYAGVNLAPTLNASYDAYESKVALVFKELGVELTSVHRETSPLKAAMEAQCIAVGGGNTWHLVTVMHRTGLMNVVKERATNGMPYMGWSAGSNVACPTLMTTNDMPIIMPPSFSCMNLIPFQINPHFLDKNPEGHGGETREDRINEFLAINPEIKVAGLREASLLEVEGNRMNLRGKRPLRLFVAGEQPVEVAENSDVSFLL